MDDEKLENQMIRSEIVNKKLEILQIVQTKSPYPNMLKETRKEIRDALANLFICSKKSLRTGKCSRMLMLEKSSLRAY